MSFGLTEVHLNVLRTIFQKYPLVNQVKIFGSRAKGSYNDRSDIDLVVVNSPIDRFTLSKIQMEFYESNIPFMLDIQLFESIKNQELVEHIQRIGKIIYQKSIVS